MMKELSYNQVQEVDGGVVWFVAAVASFDVILIGAMVNQYSDHAYR
ncbi:hypothetical protein [Pseudoalteromonas luteoviolacea]|uniref:Class IIb bacteriocin, lactobin A/cerein 7B family n=1 Tax=Pseudoalteromonas luteoviolacea S4054 TaxID=1129367 RepID=A0A0F6AHH7_9GAMM|nr:hypothetical protein [Pseudoalteromonas luteoviolacea]KKE84824.1 hypothetical protein N479_26400 [Pseudoalteromonas luteoviolacea S4054]KZN62386.1 hypothetical protein N481_25775 [Pseudoalteromonas luteoviolacea S4047-1]